MKLIFLMTAQGISTEILLSALGVKPAKADFQNDRESEIGLNSDLPTFLFYDGISC